MVLFHLIIFFYFFVFENIHFFIFMILNFCDIFVCSRPKTLILMNFTFGRTKQRIFAKSGWLCIFLICVRDARQLTRLASEI